MDVHGKQVHFRNVHNEEKSFLKENSSSIGNEHGNCLVLIFGSNYTHIHVLPIKCVIKRKDFYVHKSVNTFPHTIVLKLFEYKQTVRK
jgi:hypothetical protein